MSVLPLQYDLSGLFGPETRTSVVIEWSLSSWFVHRGHPESAESKLCAHLSWSTSRTDLPVLSEAVGNWTDKISRLATIDVTRARGYDITRAVRTMMRDMIGRCLATFKEPLKTRFSALDISFAPMTDPVALKEADESGLEAARAFGEPGGWTESVISALETSRDLLAAAQWRALAMAEAA